MFGFPSRLLILIRSSHSLPASQRARRLDRPYFTDNAADATRMKRGNLWPLCTTGGPLALALALLFPPFSLAA